MTDLPRWAYIQKRTFTAWCNQHLRERVLGIKDLFTDLSDGVLLINLLEIITKETEVASKWNKNPKMRAQMLENCNKAVQFLQKRGIKLVGIGSEDIVDCHGKLILGLIWTIILRYHIQKGGAAGKAELLEWVRKKIPECNVNDFTKSWMNGKAICHLTEALQRGTIDLGPVDSNNNALENATLGETKAEAELDIPMILSPEDMVSEDCDELSTMTYISYFRDWDLDSENRTAKRRLPDAKKSYGTLPESSEQFLPTEVVLQARNAYTKNLDHGGDPFAGTVTGPKGDVPTTLVDNGNGTYNLKFTPLDHGKHQVLFTLGENKLPVGPEPLTLQVAPSSITAQGDGLSKAEVLLPASFTVSAPKMYSSGSPLTTNNLAVSIQGDAGAVSSNLKDLGDGNIQVTYNPQVAGPHKLEIAVFSRPVAQSPYTVQVARPNAAVTFGDNSQQNAEQFIPTKTSVSVAAQKSAGVPLSANDVTIEVRGGPSDSLLPVQLSENAADASFVATWTPLDHGTHSVSISLKGQPLASSPFNVPVDKSSISVHGDGVENVEVQVPTEFVVDAAKCKNAGAPLSTKDLQVAVSAPNGQAVDNTVNDNGDGTFTVRYATPEVGNHKITVDVKARPVAKSPYSVPVAGSTISASGDGIQTGEQYIPSEFAVDAKHLADKGVQLSPDDFEVEITDPHGNKIPATVTDNGDGTFPVKYTPVNAGKHKIGLKRKGQPISGAPFTVNVDAAKTISANSTASGPGIEPEGVYIEEQAPFTIQARNRIGNPVDKGGEKFQVKVTGPDALYQAESTVNDKGDGTYPAHYVPLIVGEHTVEVTLNGEHIKDSPFLVKVSRNPLAISPAHIKAYGSGLEEGNTAEPSLFTVQAYNGNGEPIKVGGHRLGVEVLDPAGKPLLVKFVDNGDGTYSGEYQPNDIGDHKVTITLAQALKDAKPDQIANSPFTVPVIPGTDPSKCVISGPGLGLGEDVVYDTIPTWIKIQAKDKYGKDIPTGGDPFEVTAEDEQGNDVPVEVIDNQDGTYLCKYAPVNSGKHKLQARLRGKPVAGSPYTVAVQKGATEASFVEKFSFVIRTRTKDGELKNVGGDVFEVSVISPAGSPASGVEVQDLHNGSHLVSYSVATEGEYTVNVKINGRHIKGSPWRQHHFDATD